MCYLFGKGGVGMTGVAGGFEGLVEVELGSDVLADALADMEASGCGFILS